MYSYSHQDVLKFKIMCWGDRFVSKAQGLIMNILPKMNIQNERSKISITFQGSSQGQRLILNIDRLVD